MKRTLIIAWRSIWRNRRRTVISMSAIGLGLALIVIYGGLIARMMKDAQNQLDSTGLGHVEISATGWRQNRSARLLLQDSDGLAARLAASDVLPKNAEVGLRLLTRGLLSSARSNEAVEVHGVDWGTEQHLADYVRDVRQGSRPTNDDQDGILIGEELAKRMNLKLGHKLRLMVQRADGEMGAALFRVRGVFHAISPGISQRRVLISRAAAAALLGTQTGPQTGAHQIVIQIDRAADAASLAASLRPVLGKDAEVLTYAEIYPVFASMEALVDGAILVASLFVWLLVGLGIFNTMLMSVLERTREFGVMQALGTRPAGIVRQVVAESFWIATLSVLLGLAVGLSVTWFGSRAALMDFSSTMGEGIEWGGTVIPAAFRTEFSIRSTLMPALYVYLMALVVAVYPAWKVARMAPVEALRRT